MPIETRYIVFSLPETETLLRDGFAKLGVSCPPGRLVCMTARDASFVFLYNSGRKARLSPAELFVAVLWYCQRNRVPVARQVGKRLELLDRCLVLVSGDLARARPAGEALRELEPPPNCALCAVGAECCGRDRADASLTPRAAGT
jgi:hypothetical protein